MLDRQLRRSRILAESYGTPEEVQQFNETVEQPTMGDTDIYKIHILTAVNDMWENISGVEVSEEEIMADEQIREFRVGQDEPADWEPSHLSPAEGQGQGQIPEDVAEAVKEGDAEGQIASEETQDLPEEEAQSEGSDPPKSATSKSTKKG